MNALVASGGRGLFGGISHLTGLNVRHPLSAALLVNDDSRVTHRPTYCPGPPRIQEKGNKDSPSLHESIILGAAAVAVAAVGSQCSDGDRAQCMPRTTSKGAPKKKSTSQPKITASCSTSAKVRKVGKQGQLDLNLDSPKDKAFYLISREKRCIFYRHIYIIYPITYLSSAPCSRAPYQ